MLFSVSGGGLEQPFVKDYIANNHSGRFQRAFGERRAKLMMEATAGSVIGVGEVTPGALSWQICGLLVFFLFQ